MAESPFVLEQFRPTKAFSFPKRQFGSKGEERSFRAEWCDAFNWLHYDVDKDAAFCYLCMRCEAEKKFLASTKREPAFIHKGFTYWKEGPKSFKTHQGSDCHREAVDALVVLPRCTKDVGELQSAEHQAEKARNRKMLLLVLQNIRFLARQGLPLRGDGDESSSNFIQLLHLRGVDHGGIDSWLKKKTNKYTSPEIQNECLQLMALHILREVSRNIAGSHCFSILADECTDCSNKEQFTINIRWVDQHLNEHEEFIGLYQVSTIDAESLVSAIRDVLMRMNVRVADCRGQCYDGASNMSGAKKGVAAIIMQEESRALYTHCYGHALNLAVADTVKQSKICRDALDTAFEITRLIKFSPKRNAAFDKIKASTHEDDGCPSPVGIRTFCHTRWTVRGDAIESILLNYSTLRTLWEECLQPPTRLEPDVKARIVGMQWQMSTFDLLFGLKLCEQVLKMTDNLSRTLQKPSLSAAEAQHIASLTVTTLSQMRTDAAFMAFFGLVECLRTSAEVEQPSLPRKRRVPRRIDDGATRGHFSETVEEHYRLQYFEAIDLAVASIKDRFDQPGYAIYRNLEELLIKGAAGSDFSEHLREVSAVYHELDASQLKLQLSNLATYFQDNSITVSLEECLKYLRSLSPAAKDFYSEVCNVARLILVMPASNAVSERSFSVMRRIKSYLRSTMGQARLNHVMVLNIYKEQVDALDLTAIANEFVSSSEHRLRFFGRFT